ncbi:MAG TPA: nucleotide exchange factor GrpE [Spirochaetia bacterium]|nr:nucleotide exchange factor GrpE [Spirochaetia bacterium]
MSSRQENSEEAFTNSQEEQRDQQVESDLETPGAGDRAADSQNAASAAASGLSEEDDSDDRSGASTASVEELKARITLLEEENGTLKDQYLRKSAEFENFRKRMQRDKEDSIAFANKQLLLDIVPIIDDFERAIRSAEDSKDFDAFHDGVVLIEHQFTGMLERKWGLKRFESIGEEFDPSKHEAVTTEDHPDHESSIVLEDYQRGYLLHDKVLRSAKVKVSMPGSSSS